MKTINFKFNKLNPRYAYSGQFSLENLLPIPRGVTIGSNLTIDFSGATLTWGALSASGLLTVSGGVAASGSTSVDFSGSTATFKFPTGAVSGDKRLVVDVTGTTATLTAVQSGSIILMDRATGTTVTLPAPAAGLYYDFYVPTTFSGGNGKVITANTGTDFMAGSVVVGTDNTASKSFLGNGTSHVSVIFNGTTTGGTVGTQFRITGMSSTVWNVTGLLAGSSTLATPFSTS